jgi:hypothetical protein
MIGPVDLSDCCNKCVSGLKGILAVESVRRWQIVLQVNQYHHGTSA